MIAVCPGSDTCRWTVLDTCMLCCCRSWALSLHLQESLEINATAWSDYMLCVGLKHAELTQQNAWQLIFCKAGASSGDSTVYSMLVMLDAFDQALWPMLTAQICSSQLQTNCTEL